MARAKKSPIKPISTFEEAEEQITSAPELQSLRRREVYRPPFRDEGVYAPGIRGQDVAKGALAGAVAGLAAGWVMVKFQQAWGKSSESLAQRAKSKNLQREFPEHRDPPAPKQKTKEPGQWQDETSDDATIKLASKISEGVFHHKLRGDEKHIAGPAVHYAFSALMGAVYGALAEVSETARLGFGTAFGTALFVAADEIAVPVLVLSSSAEEVPVSTHLYGLASHLVYGASTEALRRPLRAAMR